ncbi:MULTISPECIES: DNA translocase FtsK [Pasteurellaceae]|uniref:DNA translocase FtsK n=1 Tax=Pasteurellaceae TaxID=712 RepID=UPI002760D89C|nr:DNA translocase FtsK [Pasteurella atlantica]MDP8034321.1 DNA translocase FtsK 4TM domain-containing protein [Pasteurella atlantica]MDP8036208.1 DNA translocase FtsK 4TM domain-containing protein [Pasteurella atlantica]MDP8038158.1 DNA translocase FtsK 4TM domain-containing protein [Pasteurella atlantica]MDP8048559.1 DNA translocase FtsK 4TM domain-containing protein [Pasteurella atlantica]MDP8050469.1 DNA translocase FtsK 4TM domain-containing protein [Pasteurella atlantica]
MQEIEVIENVKGKDRLIQFLLIVVGGLGLYLMVALLSYSPLDNSWSVSTNITTEVLNKAGVIGAWSIDLLFSSFGQVSIIVLFTLVLAPLYWLLFGVESKFGWLYLFLKLMSFILFIVGLSGLLNILFVHFGYYISGGFIGGIFKQTISSQIGEVGALLIATLFLIVGFYFCLGKALTSLVIHFYRWLTVAEDEDEIQAVTLDQEFAKNSEKSLKTEDVIIDDNMVEKENEKDEFITNQLTDVTQFARPTPNIIGLNKADYEEQVEQVEKVIQQEDDDYFDFKSTTTPVNLKVDDIPKVNIKQQIIDNAIADRVLQQNDPKVGFEEEVIKDILPQVHLDIENTETEATLEIQNDDIEDPIKNTLSIEKQQVAVEEKMVKVKENKPQYPKGYGNTLVHPLLQQHTKIPKPTTPLPTIRLMDKPPVEKQKITEQEIYEISTRIEKALADFGIKATVEDVLIGPVVTRYEIQLAPGVKSSKVINIGSDLARALMFKAIRITDVVPGKPYMGIETPNSYRETVWLRDIFESPQFCQSDAKLPMALGKDISGQAVVVDMAKMPHLLVAGQTGGGKSVGVNTMILSLLYKLTPEQVRFIMIDPKVVELSIYDNIPHLLTPVVTDMKKAVNSLRWVVDEMERRYLLLKHLSVRNIEGYNDKIEQAEAMKFPIPDPTWKPGDSMDQLPPALEKLSYIVVIIDEFSDLIMTQGKQVEEYIIRIGQKARAAGIHLILATQRPSADVITGLIKSNVPSRIAFTVASQIDSRTILDKGGAESLLGRGDMLYSAAGTPDIIRVHGAFMTDKDVERITDDWRARGTPNYINAIVESTSSDEQSGNSGEGGELDPLFDEVVAFVIDSGVTSASGVQRRFSIGFPRAARILDQLQEQGILSTPDNRGKREVLAQ